MKRCWTIKVPGHPPFQMVSLDGLLDHAGALREAQLTWPECEVS